MCSAWYSKDLHPIEFAVVWWGWCCFAVPCVLRVQIWPTDGVRGGVVWRVGPTIL